MTIDTSKETGYVVQRTLPDDGVVVVKETGYIVIKPLPSTEIRIKGGTMIFSGSIIVK